MHSVEVGTLIRMDDDATEGRRLLHKVVHPPSVAARVARFGLDLGIGRDDGGRHGHPLFAFIFWVHIGRVNRADDMTFSCHIQLITANSIGR